MKGESFIRDNNLCWVSLHIFRFHVTCVEVIKWDLDIFVGGECKWLKTYGLVFACIA